MQQRPSQGQIGIDGEVATILAYLGVDGLLDRAVVLRCGGQAVQDIGDPMAHPPTLIRAEPSGSRRRDPEPETRGDAWFLGVEGDRVLVAHEPRRFEAALGHVARELTGSVTTRHQPVWQERG